MRATIIGHAIVDVIAGPISKNLFEKGSIPMQNLKMSYGGNGYNEASVLSRFGIDVDLITKLGNDEAGQQVLNQIKGLGIDTTHVVLRDGLDTSINVVLFDENGERRFLTNPEGSQRKLAEEDIGNYIDDMADVVCFSCMFVSSRLDIPAMRRIFSSIKEKPGRTLVVDMTKAKNGETIDDIKELLPYVDYILPNEEELMLLGGVDCQQGAAKLLEYGAGCVVVKRGANGCNVYTSQESFTVIPYKIDKAVDTTGAGDSFVAGFIYGLLNGYSLKECACFANATASCSVEHVGATDGIKSIDEPKRRYEILKGENL